MDLLVVCRGNVCRSRVAAGLLTEPLEALGATVSSAGVDVPDDDVVCATAAAYLRDHHAPAATSHRPRRVTAEIVERAGLILTAEGGVTTELTERYPSARPRTFRIIWAATAMTYVADFVASGELPPGAAPLAPAASRTERWRWLVEELDAARGQLPAIDVGRDDAFYDVADPHELGIRHTDSLDRIADACERIVRAAHVVLDVGVFSPA